MEFVEGDNTIVIPILKHNYGLLRVAILLSYLCWNHW